LVRFSFLVPLPGRFALVDFGKLPECSSENYQKVPSIARVTAGAFGFLTVIHSIRHNGQRC
jgi:hypothetical protein